MKEISIDFQQIKTKTIVYKILWDITFGSLNVYDIFREYF